MSRLSGDKIRLVRAPRAVLFNLEKQFVHELPKLRVGSVKRQGFFSVFRPVNLRLSRTNIIGDEFLAKSERGDAGVRISRSDPQARRKLSVASKRRFTYIRLY